MGQSLDRAEAICAAHGSRLTPQRRRVLEILCAHRKPMGAYEILEQLGSGAKGVKPPTVYRALDFLQAMGLVHRLASLRSRGLGMTTLKAVGSAGVMGVVLWWTLPQVQFWFPALPPGHRG